VEAGLIGHPWPMCLGLVARLRAVAGGLVYVINKQSFGWNDSVFTGRLRWLLGSLSVVYVATVLAGIVFRQGSRSGWTPWRWCNEE